MALTDAERARQYRERKQAERDADRDAPVTKTVTTVTKSKLRASGYAPITQEERQTKRYADRGFGFVTRTGESGPVEEPLGPAGLSLVAFPNQQ